MRCITIILISLFLLVASGDLAFVAAQDGEANFGLPMSQWDKVHVDLEQAFGPEAKLQPGYELVYQLSANSRYRLASAAIGRLEYVVQRPDGSQYVTYCTASLISPSLVMTNYHCVPGRKTGETVERARIRFGYLQPNGPPGQAYNVVLPPIESDSTLDYSLLQVQGTPGEVFEPINLGKVRRPKSSELLFVLHHPLGVPQRLSRRNCQASLGLDLQDQNFYHCCTTQVVSSGAIVFADEDVPVPVGLHFSGGCFDDDPASANKSKYLKDIIISSPELKRIAAIGQEASEQDDRMSEAAFEFLYRLRGLRAEAEVLFRGGAEYL